MSLHCDILLQAGPMLIAFAMVVGRWTELLALALMVTGVLNVVMVVVDLLLELFGT